jgi:hypothetical protein
LDAKFGTQNSNTLPFQPTVHVTQHSPSVPGAPGVFGERAVGLCSVFRNVNGAVDVKAEALGVLATGRVRLLVERGAFVLEVGAAATDP